MDYEEFKKDVSLRLKEIRRKNNDTQEKLATEINISKENLSKIEQKLKWHILKALTLI